MSASLRALANPDIAAHSQRFFKTGKGEYAQGDRFLGIRVPLVRRQVRKFKDARVEEIQRLLASPYHEERLCALLLLVRKFAISEEPERSRLFRLYLDNTQYINNWDLVDSSASQIVGAYLEGKDTTPLTRLSQSTNLWERRIAVIATFHFIRLDRFAEALSIAERLVDDDADLIQKAVGWMLREVGKRDPRLEKAFLRKHYGDMPRTMLRYAIERFPEPERRRYLKGAI